MRPRSSPAKRRYRRTIGLWCALSTKVPLTSIGHIPTFATPRLVVWAFTTYPVSFEDRLAASVSGEVAISQGYSWTPYGNTPTARGIAVYFIYYVMINQPENGAVPDAFARIAMTPGGCPSFDAVYPTGQVPPLIVSTVPVV